MQNRFEARWISRQRADALKRNGSLKDAVVLDTFNGLIAVQPEGSRMADGDVLSPQEADYELQAAWFSGPMAKLREARQRLGLESDMHAPAGA
jgi:hypothetical protein